MLIRLSLLIFTFVLTLLLHYCPINAIVEDITNRKVLFGVPTKIEVDEIVPNNELFLFHEDGRVELIQDQAESLNNDADSQTNSDEAHIFRAKPLPSLNIENGNERKPIDNFGDVYQRFNESIFNQAKQINTDDDNPYPPLPTIDFNDDPTPITEIPITKSTIDRAQVLNQRDQEDGNVDDFNSGYRPTTEDNNIRRRTTTQEPIPIRTTNYAAGKTTTSFVYSQQTPGEGRFQHFREQELLNENQHLTTTEYPVHRDNGSGNELDGDRDEDVPPQPAPDWAVNMMFAPGHLENNNLESTNLETASEEPFLVTESLKSAFSTPNGGQALEETTTTRRPQTTVATLKTTNQMQSEVPTMKMYAWEMQRGDIDIRGDVNSLSTKSTDQNTFTPLSKRRPNESNTESNSVLMPQELPEDVDLPMSYEIGPRLVLPQDRDDGSGSGSNSLVEIPVDLPQRPPIAPPTLVSAERDRDELKRVVEDGLERFPQPTSDVSLHTAPKRGGSGALLVPISTPKTAPNTLSIFGQNERPSLPSASNSNTKSNGRPRPVHLKTVPISFTRPVSTSLPAFKVSNEDYSNEVESSEDQLFRTLATKPPGDVNSLVALPPSPDFQQGYTSQPGFEPNDGPPGILIVSSPPGYFPDNIIATTTPSYLPKTSTPYFTEILVPKRPTVRVNNDPNREYSPKVPTTTQSPKRTTSFPSQNYQDNGSSGEYVNQRVSYGAFGRTPSPSAIAYDPNVKVANQAAASVFTAVHKEENVPDSRLKVYDAPQAISNQAVRGGKAAYFFIPAPIRLSMSKAIQLRPFHHGIQQLIHTPRHLLKNAIPTIPPSLPFLSPTASPNHRTTPSRLAKFRNEQTRVTDSLEMRHNQLNWVPLGLAAPKRLGAVKLVPAHSNKERIEIQPVEDLDAKRSDQVCIVDPNDEFLDLRLEVRQIARKCFKRAVNCLLHEIVPLERRIGYTEEQCINFCGHHPFCRSMSYSTTMSMCDIFDAHNGTSPAQTFSYAGSKYYEPLDKGAIALECWKARLSDKFFTKAPQSSVLVDSDDRDDLARDQEQGDENRRTMNKTRTGPVVVAPKDKCDMDKDVVVLKSVGFRLRNFGVPALYQNSSETECVFSCLVNLARGHVPYNCASTSYGRLNGCLIYRNGMNTRGNGHLVPEEGFTHYEKACVSNELVDLCRGYPIIRQPQHTLLGYSKQAVQAQSLIECLELCFSDYSQGGNCKSVSYYYEERKDNCILNTESKQSVPQFFINEADELVDYASFESCFNSRTDLRHKASKDQKYTQRKPSRITDRRFIPHAIAPPVGSSFRETTAVYTSTLVTRPPPQVYGSLFMSKDQAEKPNAINTNQRQMYIVDTDRNPKQKEAGSIRRNSNVPIRKFLITSEEHPKMYGDEKSGEFNGHTPRQLSRVLQDSIHRLGVKRK